MARLWSVTRVTPLSWKPTKWPTRPENAKHACDAITTATWIRVRKAAQTSESQELARGQTGAAPAASVGTRPSTAPAGRWNRHQRRQPDMDAHVNASVMIFHRCWQTQRHSGRLQWRTGRECESQAYTMWGTILRMSVGAGRFAPESHFGIAGCLRIELEHTFQKPEGISRKPFG